MGLKVYLEGMIMLKKFAKPSPNILLVILWIVTLAVPVFWSLGVVRLLINPWYVEFEYRTPGFPDDPFGFTFEERLVYSKVSMAYLVNNADIDFLGDLRFPEGQTAPDFSCQFMEDCNRLYNDRELEHMLDVKVVVRAAMQVFIGSILILIAAGVWSWWGDWVKEYAMALQHGGWLTIYMIAGVIAFVLIAFSVIFVFFHQIFFASGTWTFYYSDTLIRLFPERFWRDTFLMVGALTGLGGLLTVYIAKLGVAKRS
jgi:integral membrane protein (TIGR01906 family)